MPIFEIDKINTTQLIIEADTLLKKLFPICRSLTGEGVRETLSILKTYTGFSSNDFKIESIASGTRCYDWTVPKEWNIRDAYVADLSGNRLIDFKKNNVHLVSYSIPINTEVDFATLEKHLHTLPNLTNAIPYRTSYYKEDWGFCLSHDDFLKLDRSARYKVVIDSTLSPGVMNYAESRIEGSSGQEFLISTYCCHPSLANDSLSGEVLWAMILKILKSKGTRHSYRFINVPETIGAIAYLSKHETEMKKLDGGFVLTTSGGPGAFGYKQSFLGNHLVDRVVQRTFEELKIEHIAYPFDICGSDETHYSAPFFRIPIGTVSKDKYYEYDYYHTSLDNLDFVKPEQLVETLKLYLYAIEKLEMNLTWQSLMPYCEVMLGKRGLYPSTGGQIRQKAAVTQPQSTIDNPLSTFRYRLPDESIIEGNELDAILWMMFWADGKTSTLEIAEKTKLPMKLLHNTALKLQSHELLKRISP